MTPVPIARVLRLRLNQRLVALIMVERRGESVLASGKYPINAVHHITRSGIKTEQSVRR